MTPELAHAQNPEWRSVSGWVLGVDLALANRWAVDRIEVDKGLPASRIERKFCQAGHTGADVAKWQSGFTIECQHPFQHHLPGDAQCGARVESGRPKPVKHKLVGREVWQALGQPTHLVRISPSNPLCKTRVIRAGMGSDWR